MAGYKAIMNDGQNKGNHELITHMSRPRPTLHDTRKVSFQMVLAFGLGIASAIGHDRLFASYHHREVGTEFEQRVLYSAATALAFLTKLLLALAAAMAYTQHFWLDSSEKPARVDQIDSMTAVLSNAFAFFHFRVWSRHITLWTLAMVVWCIPIAAIFTPGAITVRPTTVDIVGVEAPPQPQQSWFGVQTYASTRIDDTATSCELGAAGEPICFQNVMLRSPSVDLSRMAQLSAFENNIIVPTPLTPRMSYNVSFFSPALSCSGLSDDEKQTFNDSLTLAYEARNIWGMRTIVDSGDSSYRMLYNAWPQSFQFPNGSLVDPVWNNETIEYMPSEQDGGSELVYLRSTSPEESFNMVLLNCSLHNASYTVNYYYNDTEKNASISQFELLDRYPRDSSVVVDNPDYKNTVYYSVLFAWNQLMVGTITNASNYDTPPTNGGLSMLYTLQDFITDPTQATAPAVAARLESLFQNITISAIAAPSMQANSTEAQTLQVLTWNNVNWYVYDGKVLYIAYGVAALVSLICVIIGMLAIRKNGFSCDVDFSTIVSTSRNLVHDGDPRDLARTTLVLRNQVFEIVDHGSREMK